MTRDERKLALEQEPRKGHWIEDGYYNLPCVCSYCGHEGRYDMKYCPNCGADMRKVEKMTREERKRRYNMKITFYYNDGSAYEKAITTLQDAGAIECGVLRGLYSIALDDPENFKKHFVVGYKLENDKGEMIDSHIYRKVERV